SLGSTVGSTAWGSPGGSVAMAFAWTVTKNGTAFASGTSSNITFTPDDSGTYVITLTVTGAGGSQGSDTQTLTVDMISPTANAGGWSTGPAGSAVSFTGSAPDSSSADFAAGFTFTWNFGDGTTATGASPTHVYQNSGTYTVSLTVTDQDGESGTAS